MTCSAGTATDFHKGCYHTSTVLVKIKLEVTEREGDRERRVLMSGRKVREKARFEAIMPGNHAVNCRKQTRAI